MDNNIKIVEHVVDYIEEHLEDQLDLDYIARQADMSYSSFGPAVRTACSPLPIIYIKYGFLSQPAV